MKTITICIFICAFMLLRPYQMQESGLLYTGDDYSYFAHATSLAFGQFPSYKNEFFTDGDTMPMHNIGPGLMAAPFVYCFSLIDRIEKSDIIFQRTCENIFPSWSLFGFVFAASVYFWLACFLLYRGLRNYFSERYASLSIILIVLCQGLPLFVFRRPVFSHAYEFFLQSFMVYVLTKAYKSRYFDSWTCWKLTGIGIVMGLMVLVRPNNIFAALFWPFIFLASVWRRDAKSAPIWKMLILPYMVFLALMVCLKLLPEAYNHSSGYGTGIYSFLLQLYPASFYLKHFVYILFGVDWGLIFTAPFILIGLIALFGYRFPLRRSLLICLIPMITNLYISIALKIHGGWYGYRFLITSVIPIIVYPLALTLENFEAAYGKKIGVFLILIAIFPLLSMLGFEGNSSNLTLSIIKERFGGTDWGNNTYQLEIWKTLLFNPFGLFIAIFKGGALYLVYLGASLLHITHILPMVASKKYSHFEFSVLVKTFILYALPFLLYWIMVKRKHLGVSSGNK